MDLDLEPVRKAGRWLALLAILALFVIFLIELLSPLSTPPVKMPGGDRVDLGVSQVLDDSFLAIDGDERLHFVVQFERELTPSELTAKAGIVGSQLDGPIPTDAYITSALADKWVQVREDLKSGVPAAIRIFEFIREDRLSPELKTPDNPSLLFIPTYAEVVTDQIEIFVRFFDDVSLTEQRGILESVFATQPGQTEIARGPTGVWAVVVSRAGIESLALRDQVRFISPTTPPPEDDMDQARGEIGATLVPFDGAGTTIAQWESCHPTVLHTDLQNRVDLIGKIWFDCRKWQFQDVSTDTIYQIGEPIGVDIDEDGMIDEILDAGANQAGGAMWLEIPLRIENGGSQRYMKVGALPDIVEINDIRFDIDYVHSTVTPVLETIPGTQLDPRLFYAERHPTQVAGILISDGQTDPMPGVLPAASVRSHGWNHLSKTHEYPDAIAAGARISSNSFGWRNDYHYIGTWPYFATSQFYDEVVSGRGQSGAPTGLAARMLIVASSGNHGMASAFWRTGRIINSAKNVITVGNVSSSVSGNPGVDLGVPAASSGRGPTMDGRLTPILSAPGTQLQCLPVLGGTECSPEGDGGITATSVPVPTYEPNFGTSFSTPLVSGAAGQLQGVYEAECEFEPAPQDLRALLVHSARDLTETIHLTGVPASTELTGPDFVFGYGMVQVDKAVELVRNAITNVIDTGWVEHRLFLNSYDQLVDDGGGKYQMRVTLVWDDPPYYYEYLPRAVTGMLQNDLDLEIIGPDGRRHLPWVLDPSYGNEAQPATHESRPPLLYVLQRWRDHANTIEQVVVDDVKPGMMNQTWTVRVRGFKIRRGPQDYTLVSEVFQSLPMTACGAFSNGATVIIENPLDVPDTALAWFLFWLAVIILVWATFETVVWLFQKAYNKYGLLVAILMVLFVIAMLYYFFHLLIEPDWLYVAIAILVLMAYVLWRAATQQYSPLIALLVLLFVLVVLYIIFQLMMEPNLLYLAVFVLIGMAYVLWRAVNYP